MADSRQENAVDSQHAVAMAMATGSNDNVQANTRSPQLVQAGDQSASASTRIEIDTPHPAPALAVAGSAPPKEEFVAIEIQSLPANPPEGAFVAADQEEARKQQQRGSGDGGQADDDESRICRVCHLCLGPQSRSNSDVRDGACDGDDDPVDHGDASSPIELGCACKDDLAFAHKRCAETWFKIKGDRNCEICGELAHNVAGCMDDSSCGRRSCDEQSDAVFEQGSTPAHQRFWQHRPICNFVLAFIVVILLLPWLFRIRLF